MKNSLYQKKCGFLQQSHGCAPLKAYGCLAVDVLFLRMEPTFDNQVVEGQRFHPSGRCSQAEQRPYRLKIPRFWLAGQQA